MIDFGEIENMKIEYRVLTELDDILSLELLARDIIAESRFSYFSFSEEKFRRLALDISKNPNSQGLLVAYIRGKPFGLIYCSAGELALGYGHIITTVTMFFVDKSIRHTLLGGKSAHGLLAGLESWSKARNAREVLFHANFGSVSERVHKFLKRRGFETVGGTYAKPLS